MQDDLFGKVFYQSLNESEQINERPYGRTQSFIDKTKSKVKSFTGSGQVEQGAYDVGQMANSFWKEFQYYLGRRYGKFPDVVPVKDLTAFFRAKDLDTKHLTSQNYDKRSAGEVILKATRDQADDYKKYNDKEVEQDDVEQQQNDVEQDAESPQTTKQTSGYSGILSQLSTDELKRLQTMLS